MAQGFAAGAAAQAVISSAGVSTGGNTAGNTTVQPGQLVLQGGNNITLSELTAAGSLMTVVISGGAAGGAGFSAGVSTGGNTAGTTSIISSQLILAGGNNITLSEATAAGGLATVTISAFNQSVQTQGFLNSISVIGNTAGTTSAGTGSVILAGGNNIILSGSTAAGGMTLTVSGSNQSEQTQNRFDLTLSGNTAGTMALVSSGTLTLAGGANIVLSQSGTNAITISASNQSVQTQGFLNSISVLGNTSGTTSAGTGSIILAGGNNITLSGSTAAGGMTLTVSAFTQTVQTQGFLNSISVIGNTAGTTSAGTGSLVLAGGPNITLSGSTAAGGMTVSVSAPAAGGGAAPTLSFWQNQAAGTYNIGSSLPVQTLKIFPLVIPDRVFPGNMTANTIFLDLSYNFSVSTASTDAHTYSWRMAFYTISASSTLNQLFSAESTFGFAAASDNSSKYHGPRFLTFHSSLFNIQPTFSQGEYYCGLWQNTSGTVHGSSFFGAAFIGSEQRSGTVGTSLVTNTTMGFDPVLGFFTSGFTTALPASLALSQIGKQGNAQRIIPHLVFDNLMSAF